MTIPTLLMLFESHALSIKTPVKNLRKNLHKLTIIVVMSAVIHQMEFFVDNAFVNLVAKFPFVYEQEPCYNQNFNDNYFPQNFPSFSQQYLCCAYCGGPHHDYQCQPINETCYEPNPSYDYSSFDHPQPPQDSVDHQGILQVLNKMKEKFEEIIRDGRKKKEDMSIEEMIHEQQLVDREMKEIINDLGIKRFRGDDIDEEYERDCEIRIRKLKQDFNIWGSEVRKSEAYEDKRYSDDTSDVPNCDNNRVNVESDLVESLINHDTSIVYSSKIDPILEEFADELAHIAPIPPGIVEADFDPNDDTLSDDDDFEDIEYVRFEEVNDVEQ
ncbi:hypothetical protein Tco_1295104 [Tanacetum coccineum]